MNIDIIVMSSAAEVDPAVVSPSDLVLSFAAQLDTFAKDELKRVRFCFLLPCCIAFPCGLHVLYTHMSHPHAHSHLSVEL